MKALILDGKVVDIANTEFEVHSSMSWVSIPEGTTVEVGYEYANGAFAHWDKRTDEEKAAANMHRLRSERNKRLAATDYLALGDNTLSTEMAAYRQALRDITDTYSSVDDVVWPTKPGE